MNEGKCGQVWFPTHGELRQLVDVCGVRVCMACVLSRIVLLSVAFCIHLVFLVNVHQQVQNLDYTHTVPLYQLR